MRDDAVQLCTYIFLWNIYVRSGRRLYFKYCIIRKRKYLEYKRYDYRYPSVSESCKDILNISNTTNEDYKIFDMGGKLINSGKLERGGKCKRSYKGAYMIQIGEV
jgi:hypothetical protein